MIRNLRCTLATVALMGVIAGPGLCVAEQAVPEKTAPALTTYTGVITKVPDVATEDKTLYFRMSVSVNQQEQNFWIATAPVKYLAKIGLQLKPQLPVIVTGQEVLPTGNIERHFAASTISVNGKEYKLRDAKGAPAWSYWDLYMEVATVTGEITKVQAAAVTTEEGLPGAGIQRPNMKYMTVTAGGKTYTVVLAPQAYLDGIKFAPAVGMQVVLTGWTPIPRQQQAEGTAAIVFMHAKQLTVDGTIYQFRDATGKVLWGESPKPAATPDRPREGVAERYGQ
jgi:hypothetical protein